MVSSTRTFEGRWRKLPNLAAGLEGTIHDDARARELGFRRGFVPGPAVAQAMMPAIIARFGQRWYEGGWYDLKFISPVYVDDEVQEIAEPLDEHNYDVAVRLTTRDGRLTCGGRAGLGERPPWDAARDGARLPDVAFPHLELGSALGEREVTITADDFLASCDAAGDDSPWYRERSPWGAPVVPPIGLLRQARHGQSALPVGEGVIPPPINADFQVLIERPVFVGERYRVSTRLADKGVSGRCWFRTVEVEITGRDGERCAVARQNVKWFSVG